MTDLRIGYFPYKPGGNPYQALFAGALESQQIIVDKIPPKKILPLSLAVARGNDLLQMDWPHDWYEGRNQGSRAFKRIMYEAGLASLGRVPSVWTVHNLVAHDARDRDYDQHMIQKLISRCEGLIVLSRYSEMELRSRYQVSPTTRVSVIHHGHYMDVYPRAVTREEARRRLGLPLDAPVAVSLGRLLPYKGLEELIHGFNHNSLRDGILLIGGSCGIPGYVAKLEAQALDAARFEDQIRIHGHFINDDDLQVYFAAADVVVLPFKHIHNSGSLLLAMSFGKCVVAPDVGSIAEVACPAGWFRYDANEKEGLIGKLQAALEMTDRVARETAVTQFTKDRYSWSQVGAKAEALYREIL